MQMDKYYKAKGYKRISLNKVQGLDDKIHHGIDGIYYNPNKTQNISLQKLSLEQAN